MNATEGLIDRFAGAAVQHWDGLAIGNYRRTNIAADTIQDIVVRLGREGDKGQMGLARLMDHHEIAVRIWAARECLFLAKHKTKAISTIEALAKEEGLMGLEAETTLQVWLEGSLHDPWPATQANCNCPTCRNARSQAIR